MENSKKLITIGMPVFNDIDFIEASLKSILAQTVKDFVLIISDDGATDGSEDICKQYAAQDARIIYIRQPVNLGISKNMEFLLVQAKTPYFMWAADDDIWHSTYIEKLIELLKSNEDTVAAFSTFAHIDENGTTIENNINIDYSHSSTYHRLNNFIKHARDEFGYGIFKTDEIKKVRFPIWAWPNHKTPYNNIYPSLCFYLAKGNYINCKGAPLFFKRIKTPQNTNHITSGAGNAIKESLFYFIRRFNLVMYSCRLINKAGGLFLAIQTFPTLFHYWFIKPSSSQFKLAFNAFLKRVTR